ncbi:hypothetical protein VPNG_07828 [Cytospora leucostoma]|uniref:Uncharacterized protein n=1 Tax=Cytospora leucostoma TaxID=1230097 RepID=A0A423WEI1_9PEZI|nr:hypothetical protein VPNG_07828 [Cytospora leucostoma]
MSTSPNLPAGAFITTLGGKSLVNARVDHKSDRPDNHLSIANCGGHLISKRGLYVVKYDRSGGNIYNAKTWFRDCIAPDSTGTDVSGATAVSSISAKGGRDNHGSSSTIAIAGGVIGGLAVAGLLAFLLWFWKRRIQKRRSTLLTPLSADPSFGGEKEETERGDGLRPTPNPSKFKASVRAQYDRFRGREASSASPTYDYSVMTTKERIRKIWAGLRVSQRRGFRTNENRKDVFAARAIRGGMKEEAKPRARPLPTNKPDSIMEDGILDSEAQQRRLSRIRGGSLGTALGRRALNSGDDPFSDVNAAKYTSANPPTHFATGADNPFSDANVIGERGYVPKTSSYVSDVRHSRTRSVDSTVALGRAMRVRAVDGVTSRPPSNSTTAYAESSLYLRDSASSFDTRRNRFRSDPFDLEPLSHSHTTYGLTAAVSSDLPTVSRSGIRRDPSNDSQRYQQSMGPIGGDLLATEGNIIRKPIAAARATYDSLGSSRYTSGVSQGTVDDWPEPGPDIGPTALWSGAGQSSSATGS